jgi:signal transduction histidine kinase
MNIKFKLTLWFTCIVAAILLTSFYIVYENYAIFRQHNFYERLKERTVHITDIMVESDSLTAEKLQTINNYSLSISPNLRVTVYNLKNEMVNHIGRINQSPDKTFNSVLKKKYIEEQINDTQYVYFSFQSPGKETYVAIGSAFDRTGFKKVVFLRNLFVLILIISIITTAFAGWRFARLSLKPMNDVVQEAENITAKNLHKRLSVGASNDEIANLAQTFNQMLDRLEASFELQKDFVSNASHEFRTPLTSIKGQLQVALLKQRTPEEYVSLLQSLNDDINKIISLLHALQELAKANADFPMKDFKSVSVLETVIEARAELIKNNPHYSIDLNVNDVPENLDLAYCMGDVNLMKSAFTNLMDNGCKFSPDYKTTIDLYFYNTHVKICVKDEGVGISEEDIPHVFEPFFRSNDTRNIYGHGIGLSLVKKVVEWHKGQITFSSELGKGTTFCITLPNITTYEEV